MKNKCFRDPVCGMELQEEDVVAKSDYKGKTYYFCEASCKTKFDKDPDKYIKDAPTAKCGCC